MDDDLTRLLKPLRSNPINEIKMREIVEVFNGKNPIVTIFPSQKYVRFNEDFIPFVGKIEELKPFLRELKNQGYDSNYD